MLGVAPAIAPITNLVKVAAGAAEAQRRYEQPPRC